jgi:DNA-directed RNA polymerase subunit RPC12/RpoP
VTCSFCGREFDETQAEKECRGCSLVGGCRNVKCPYCGYEMPREPVVFKKLKTFWEKQR